MNPRATPLPPDERRAQILQVTRPLLLEFGARVTTRQIADAAGLAEGTLFRIFPTKTELLFAVVHETLDPTESCVELRKIDIQLPLHQRVTQAITILGSRVQLISSVMMALRDLTTAGSESDEHERLHEAFRCQNEAIGEVLAGILSPDAHELRIPADHAASYLRAIVLVAYNPMLHLPGLGEPDQLADLLLHGFANPTKEI